MAYPNAFLKVALRRHLPCRPNIDLRTFPVPTLIVRPVSTTWTRLLSFLLSLALLLLAVAPVVATVRTDKADYAPGSVVTISGDNSDGAGYLPGENVDVAVSGPNGYAASCSAVADEAGAWSCQVTLWDSGLAIGDYSYTATGADSAVSQSGTFTDGNIAAKLAGGPTSATMSWTRYNAAGDCTTSGPPVPTAGSTSVNNASFASLTAVNTGQSLLITAPAIAGYVFSSWSGDVSSAANPVCVAGITGSPGNKDVVANYIAVPTAVTTTVGSITATNSTFGGTTDLSATVSPAGAPGTVDFYVDGSATAIPAAYNPGTGVATVTGYTHGLNAGTYSVKAAFTSDNTANYTDSDATSATALVVGAVDPTCDVDGFTGDYDGNAHGATNNGCTGVGDAALTGTFTPGASFTDVPGGTANWSFDPDSGNYNTLNGTAAIVINALELTGTLTVADKIWDGTTDADYVLGLTGVLPGEDCELTGTAQFPSSNVGTYNVVLQGAALSGPDCGNYVLAAGAIQDTASILNAYRITGFYQPVEMTPHGTTPVVLNLVKNGSTVPLKFEVFNLDDDGNVTSEVTSIAGVGIRVDQIACGTGVVEDPDILVTSTSVAGLRYDTTDGQFIFNWKVPGKPVGRCFHVWVVTGDAAPMSGPGGVPALQDAYFKTK
jgi:hypothetical protein